MTSKLLDCAACVMSSVMRRHGDRELAMPVILELSVENLMTIMATSRRVENNDQ